LLLILLRVDCENPSYKQISRFFLTLHRLICKVIKKIIRIFHNLFAGEHPLQLKQAKKIKHQDLKFVCCPLVESTLLQCGRSWEYAGIKDSDAAVVMFGCTSQRWAQRIFYTVS
jgi:hypothetical protein